jgi:co-chaperonin GroES (HSP10)
MMLTPLADRILIKPDTPDDTTDSGLVMVRDYAPENAGTVVAVPERCGHLCPECGSKVFAPPSVQVGDTVLFGYDAGQEITIDDARYLLIRDADLIAVLQPEETHG